MAGLLHIVASPRVESYSTRVAQAFCDSYRQARPDDQIEVLDLFKADIPPFHAPAAKAKYAVAAGQPPRDEAEAAWKAVIQTVDHFKRFDKYVLSCPMWNFSIPYRLKQYIDVIVQPSLTVSFSPGKATRGLWPAGRWCSFWPAGAPIRRATRARPSTSRRPTCGEFSDSSASRTFGASRSRARCKTRATQVEANTRRAIAEASRTASELAGQS